MQRPLKSHMPGTPHRAEDIAGWMFGEELPWLSRTAATMQSVIEVGCWKGRSTFALLEGCPGTVYAVDHWKGSAGEEVAHAEARQRDIFQDFWRNVGHFPNLKVCRMASAEAATVLPDVDMVFLDGGHEYEEICQDIRLWTPKAKRMICGHDSNWPGVDRAIEGLLPGTKRGEGSIWYIETPICS